jgi:hypothetical protein
MTEQEMRQKLQKHRTDVQRSSKYVESFGPEWVVDSEDMPPELVLFFFRGQRVGFHLASVQRLRSYVKRVLDRRKPDLDRARANFRVAACLNDTDSCRRWRSLIDSLEAIVKVHEFMDVELSDAQNPVEARLHEVGL